MIKNGLLVKSVIVITEAAWDRLALQGELQGFPAELLLGDFVIFTVANLRIEVATVSNATQC